MLQRGEPAARLAAAAKPLYQLVYDKWRVDELYEETFIGAVDSLADVGQFYATRDPAMPTAKCSACRADDRKRDEGAKS